MNDYFNFDVGRMQAGEPALAEDVNDAIDGAVAGFDKLPDLASLFYLKGCYVESTGSLNQYLLALDEAEAYTDGMMVAFKASHTNSGAVVLNVNSLGDIPLTNGFGGALVVGDIVEDHIYQARYNSSSGNFELASIPDGNMSDVETVAENMVDLLVIADNMAEILLADDSATAAAASAAAALVSETNAAASAASAAASAANLPNATTAGADKLVITNATGDGWEYPDVTDAGLALMDDATAAAQRTTLGLGSVDNTADADKPVSTAQAAAIAAAVSAGVAAVLPVGSIIAFLPGYFTAAANVGFTAVHTNTVAGVNAVVTAYGFRVCDGTSYYNASSPYYGVAGRYLPYLTDDRFLQGDATAGSTGGDNVMEHTHTTNVGSFTSGSTAITTAQMPAHTHTTYCIQWAETNPNRVAQDTSTGMKYAITTVTSSSTGSGSGHTHTVNPPSTVSGAASYSQNRPQFLSCFYLIKVV